VSVKRKKARPRAERGRAADPERTTELLWGRQESAERRPKSGLSLDRIVKAAIELADTEGLEAVSMRRIAERLGFTTMSLYRHVPGKGELTALMRETVFGEVARPARSPDQWRAALETWARQGWALYARHPWLALLSGTRQVPGPNIIADYEYALKAVSGTGLQPAEMVAVVELVGKFVMSAARRVVEAAQTEKDTGVTEAEWWGGRGSLFDRLGPYPTLGYIWESGGYDRPEDPLEFGLKSVLDGIDVLVRSRKASPSEV
jgi:AcrR family transcriptional regulator